MTADRSRTIDVTIRIDAGSAQRFDEIVHALESSGLQNAEVHRRFLTLNGSVAEDGVDALRAVAGVASVREDRTYKRQTPSPRRA